MDKNNAIQRSPSSIAVPLATFGLAAVLLIGIGAVPRAVAISSMPWKVELLAGLFLIPFAVWLKKGSLKITVGPASNIPVVLIIAFIVWSALSVLWAESAGWVVHHTLTWLVYLSFLVSTLVLVRRQKGFTIIFGVFGLVSLVLGLMVIADFLTLGNFAENEGILRVRYGKFAELMLTASPVLCGAAMYVRRRTRAFMSIVLWLLGWLVVMLSLSKGAFIAGIIAHAVLFAGCIIFSGRSTRRKALKLAMVWLVLTVVVQASFSILSSIPSTTDYITGKADKTRFTSIFRTFVWQVGAKMATDNWLTGVGADNFGIAFNEARTNLAKERVADKTPEIAEDYMVERAHNEFLQIFGELGIVGLVLSILIFAAFLYYACGAFARHGFRMSPIFWAALAGMTGFMASSMVSSFSFRAIQNGIVFFIAFGVAVNEVLKLGLKRSADTRSTGSTKFLLPVTLAGILMLAFAGIKGFAEYELYYADRAETPEQAEGLYTSALSLDPDNANAYYFLASILAANGDNAAAAKYLRQGIDRGVGVTLTYSKLAEYQQRAGDTAAGKETLLEATSIFPNSVFIHVRRANFFRDIGDPEAAAREMAIASSIDAGQAAGWDLIMREGSLAAFYKSKQDSNIAPPAELLPANAVLEYVDKSPFSQQ